LTSGAEPSRHVPVPILLPTSIFSDSLHFFLPPSLQLLPKTFFDIYTSISRPFRVVRTIRMPVHPPISEILESRAHLHTDTRCLASSPSQRCYTYVEMYCEFGSDSHRATSRVYFDFFTLFWFSEVYLRLLEDSGPKHGDCSDDTDSEYTTGSIVVRRLSPSHHSLIPVFHSRVCPACLPCVEVIRYFPSSRLYFVYFRTK
jgi:hypothetical protein